MDAIQATNIKDLIRLRGNRKQADIAKRLNVDPSKISRIEGGDVTLADEELKAYLDAISTEEAGEYWEHLARRWAIVEQPDFWHPQREELAAADRALSSLDDFVIEKSVGGPLLAQFNLHRDSLSRAVDYLQRLDHDIAFIGDIGVGKSTAICNLIGLLIKDDSTEGPELMHKAVLETNTGGATICEVRIKHRPDTGYGILVQPQSMDEVFNAVGDLCYSIKGSSKLARTNGSEATEAPLGTKGVAVEVNRALRNMAKLARTSKKSSDGKVVRIDPAMELAQEMGSLDRFKAEFFARLKLLERTQTELWHDPSSGPNGLRWLKDTFSAINNGRRPDVSLPKRIDILIPDQLFNHPFYPIQIIDTKGVDGTAIRPDIESYIDTDRTLTVLCTGYHTAPDPSIQHLMEHLSERGADSKLRDGGLLLVLVHSLEAFGTRDESSGVPVSEAAEAYSIKQDSVEEKLTELGADGLPIHFYNATSDNPKDVETALLDLVDRMRRSRINQISETESAIRRLMEHYDEAQATVANAEVRRQLAIFLEDHAKLPARIRQPYQALVDAMRSGHPSTVWASTRRNGTWLNLDVYHFIGIGTAIDARLRSQKAMARLTSILAQMEGDEHLAQAADFIAEIGRSSTVWQSEFLAELSVAGREIYRATLYDDDLFWGKCQDLWGQGIGYRNEVADKIQEWCEASNQQTLVTAIEDRVNNAWNERIVDRLRLLSDSSPVNDLRPGEHAGARKQPPAVEPQASEPSEVS